MPILLQSRLFFCLAVIFAGVTAAQEESPRRKVETEGAPDPRRAVGTVPLARFEAFRDVRLAPEPETVMNEAAPVAPVILHFSTAYPPV